MKPSLTALSLLSRQKTSMKKQFNKIKTQLINSKSPLIAQKSPLQTRLLLAQKSPFQTRLLLAQKSPFQTRLLLAQKCLRIHQSPNKKHRSRNSKSRKMHNFHQIFPKTLKRKQQVTAHYSCLEHSRRLS